MPEIRIPLVGSFNTRGPFNAYETLLTTGKDQLFNNCEFDVSKNPVTGEATVYCSKPWYYSTTYLADDGVHGVGADIISSDFGGNTWVISSFSNTGTPYRPDLATASKIYALRPGSVANTSMGIATGAIIHIVETIIGGVKIFLMTSTDGTGWFLAKDSITSNDTSINVGATFTANTTSGSPTLASVSSFAGRYVGQALSGTGIPAGARIQAMDTGASTITMTDNATANGTGVTVTAERIAKIIDADFPSDVVGPFACLGGFNFVMTENGRVYNSNLNSIVSWTAGDYLSTNFYPDNAKGGTWVVNNKIAAIGSRSFEWFYNAGNPSGSPLSPSPELNFPIGALNSRAITSVSGSLIWLSSLDFGSSALYVIDGNAPRELPTTQLNQIIGSVLFTPVKFPVVLTYYKLGGKKKLVLGGRFVLDMDNMIWSCCSESSAIPHRATGVFDVLGYETTGGAIYSISSSANVRIISSQSIGSAVEIPDDLSIRTKRIDLGTGNRKSVQYYELDSDVQSSGTATLEVSDDDFQTWTTIGTFDMTQVNPRIYRGGSWKGGRAHRITHSANTPFRASTMTIKYEVGQH
jgi:hypothetical protein